jgi:hypothetical protein
VPSITSIIMLAALASVPAVVFVAWVGLLFHRVLRLPTDQQKHGVTVLKQLTELVRVGATRRSVGAENPRPRRRAAKGSQDEGRP